jgi:uncharacterized protein YhaN
MTAQTALKEVGVEEKALSIVDQAKAVKVTDAESYTAAGELFKSIVEMMKEVDRTFDPIIEAAHKSHKAALEQKKKYYDPLDKAKRSVKGLLSDYDREQERKKREEEARLREIARKEEEERKLAEALAAEAAGEKEEAEAIMEEPVYIPPVVVKKEVPRVQGLSFRTVWKFHIKDVTAIPRQYMTPDMVKIGGVVRAMKGQTNIPGLEVYEERV